MLRAVCLCLLVSAVGCTSLTRTFLSRTGPKCRTPVVSSSGFPEQSGRVIARTVHRGDEQRGTYHLESAAGGVVFVGLRGPGVKAFTVRHEGRSLDSDITLGGDLIHPETLLHAIERAYWIGIADTPLGDGEHRAVVEGGVVHETWEGGRLIARRFDKPRMLIRYEAGNAFVADETCGYELELRASFSSNEAM